MPSKLHLTRLAGLAVLATVVGCGGPYDSTVSGDVTLDGAPVPYGTVTFHSISGGPAAYARIEDGSYSLNTGAEEGLPSGEYEVTVAANEPPAAEQVASGTPPPYGKQITPARYRSRQTSGLKYNVTAGHNQIDLQLTSTPPAG
jgi:hypothetical protein